MLMMFLFCEYGGWLALDVSAGYSVLCLVATSRIVFGQAKGYTWAPQKLNL